VIDLGLAISLGATLGVPLGLARWLPPTVIGRRDLLDTASIGLFVGVVAGRAASMAASPAGVGTVRDFLVLRGGAEFWVGMVAGAVAIAIGVRRRRDAPMAVLADLAPYGLAAVGVYQAMCLVRDGCYGPRSTLGLTPPGTNTAMFPVEVTAGLFLLAAAFLLRHSSALRPRAVIASAVAAVAVTRLAGAALLPVLGSRWSRTTVESVLALTLGAVVLGGEGRTRLARRSVLDASARRHPSGERC